MASPKLTRISKKRTLITAKAATVSKNELWSSSESALEPLQLLASLLGRACEKYSSFVIRLCCKSEWLPLQVLAALFGGA